MKTITPVSFSVPNTSYEVVVLDYDRERGLSGLVYNPRSSKAPIKWNNQWIAVKRGVKKSTGGLSLKVRQAVSLLANAVLVSYDYQQSYRCLVIVPTQNYRYKLTLHMTPKSTRVDAARYMTCRLTPIHCGVTWKTSTGEHDSNIKERSLPLQRAAKLLLSCRFLREDEVRALSTYLGGKVS